MRKKLKEKETHQKITQLMELCKELSLPELMIFCGSLHEYIHNLGSKEQELKVGIEDLEAKAKQDYLADLFRRGFIQVSDYEALKKEFTEKLEANDLLPKLLLLNSH